MTSSAESRREHWDRRYAGADTSALSWFQARPAVSLELVTLSALPRSAGVIDVGGGASTLVDSLVNDGWSDVTVLDASDVALSVARDRVGDQPGVSWLAQDLLSWRPQRQFDLWHDRAAFHFLVDESDRRRYRQVLDRALAPGGTVIVGAFGADGPTHCSGLPVARYDAASLADALGGAFDVVATTAEEHRTPAGSVQPFTWVMLRRTTDRSAIDSLLDAARTGLDRVQPDDLADEMAAGALVVDIRPLEQRQRDGTLPGALVIDRNVLEWRLDPSCPHHAPEATTWDRRIIVVCNEGYSSSLAAATLRQLGLLRATDLVGGFQAYSASPRSAAADG